MGMWYVVVWLEVKSGENVMDMWISFFGCQKAINIKLKIARK